MTVSGTLGGSGLLNADVSVTAGGTPGPDNSPGLLSIVGNLDLGVSSTTLTELGGFSASLADTFDILVADSISAYINTLTFDFTNADLTEGLCIAGDPRRRAGSAASYRTARAVINRAVLRRPARPGWFRPRAAQAGASLISGTLRRQPRGALRLALRAIPEPSRLARFVSGLLRLVGRYPARRQNKLGR